MEVIYYFFTPNTTLMCHFVGPGAGAARRDGRPGGRGQGRQRPCQRQIRYFLLRPACRVRQAMRARFSQPSVSSTSPG